MTDKLLNCPFCGGERKCWDSFDKCTFILSLLQQSTVDAVEVVHGEWVKSNPHNRFMDCSVCGFYQDHTTFNYCPNCGAKMDGGDKKNEMDSM